MQSVTKVRPVPQGYHTVTPYLIVEGAPKVIEFLKRTFNAEEKDFMSGPEGRVAHAEMKIGVSDFHLGVSHAAFRAAHEVLLFCVEGTFQELDHFWGSFNDQVWGDGMVALGHGSHFCNRLHRIYWLDLPEIRVADMGESSRAPERSD